MIAFLVLSLLVPRDTTLVELLLVSTNERVVVEAVQQDSTLLLPANALHDLLGVSFPVAWVSLDQLRRAYPTIVVRWSSEMGQVAIWDELHVLPAVRTFYESRQASAFNTLAIPQYSGPFGRLSVSDQRRALLSGGYLYKGRLAVLGQVNDSGRAAWNVSAAPFSRLFLNYSGATRQPAQVSGRIAAGPFWVTAAYTEQRPVEVAGLLRLGAMQTFVSREFGVLTVTPPGSQITVQIARQWETRRTAASIGFGPNFSSPFSFPQVR